MNMKRQPYSKTEPSEAGISLRTRPSDPRSGSSVCTGGNIYSAIIYLDMGVFFNSAQPNVIFRNYLFGNGTFYRNALSNFDISQLFISLKSWLSIPAAKCSLMCPRVCLVYEAETRTFIFRHGNNPKPSLSTFYISQLYIWIWGNLKTALAELYIPHYFNYLRYSSKMGGPFTTSIIMSLAWIMCRR